MLDEKNVYKMSNFLSFSDASSMQLVFMTSYQMLITRAKLQTNEKTRQINFKVLGRIPASKVTFAQLRIFSDFPSTFAEPKIYLYLTDSKNFGCFEKL